MTMESRNWHWASARGVTSNKQLDVNIRMY
jgi:hypothetical protein